MAWLMFFDAIGYRYLRTNKAAELEDHQRLVDARCTIPTIGKNRFMMRLPMLSIRKRVVMIACSITCYHCYVLLQIVMKDG